MIFSHHKAKEDKPQTVGALGERLAADYLRKHGYKIIAKNHRDGGHEETDIIAETRTERVFAEVKTRTMPPEGDPRFGRPADAVTKEKRRHLLNAARIYNATHPTEKRTRMDVIEVYLTGDGEKDARLRHIIDAFRS